MTSRTKKINNIKWILFSLSQMLTVGPLLVYAGIALSGSSDTKSKAILLSMISVSVIFSLVCIINKYTPRCKVWFILLGLYLCLDHFLGCVLLLAITQTVDELVVVPLYKHYKQLYVTNKEIDKRLPGNG